MPLTDTLIRNAKPGAKPISYLMSEGYFFLLPQPGVSGGDFVLCLMVRKNYYH